MDANVPLVHAVEGTNHPVSRRSGSPSPSVSHGDRRRPRRPYSLAAWRILDQDDSTFFSILARLADARIPRCVTSKHCGYNATKSRRLRNRLFFEGNQHHRNVFPMRPIGRRARFRS
jgi:hypothetical protein